MEISIPEPHSNREVPFKQTTKAGCVSLSLANIFNNPNFVVGIENLQKGERTVDANKKLADYEPYCYIEPVFLTHYQAAYNRLLDPFVIDHKLSKIDPNITVDHFRPFLMTVHKPADELKPFDRYHTMAVFQDMGSAYYYVIDSMQSYIRRMYVTQLIAYHHIIGIDGFGMWDHPDPSNAMFIHRSALTHIV